MAKAVGPSRDAPGGVQEVRNLPSSHQWDFQKLDFFSPRFRQATASRTTAPGRTAGGLAAPLGRRDAFAAPRTFAPGPQPISAAQTINTYIYPKTLTPTPTRFGLKMSLYLSDRPLDRTKSISAPSSNFDPETKKCEYRSHFWAGASLGGPGTFPGKLNFTLIHLNSFNFTLIICADLGAPWRMTRLDLSGRSRTWLEPRESSHGESMRTPTTGPTDRPKVCESMARTTHLEAWRAAV